MAPRAASRVAASRKRTRIVCASRATPPWRMPFSRSCPRTSAARFSMRLVIAACMSICSRKCTPPRRSSPRYIGRAWIAVSQFGEAGSRFRATVYDLSALSGLSARSSVSRALSCVSGSVKRTRTPVASTCTPV
jgi:hypothetical protein